VITHLDHKTETSVSGKNVVKYSDDHHNKSSVSVVANVENITTSSVSDSTNANHRKKSYVTDDATDDHRKVSSVTGTATFTKSENSGQRNIALTETQTEHRKSFITLSQNSVSTVCIIQSMVFKLRCQTVSILCCIDRVCFDTCIYDSLCCTIADD